MISNSSSNYEGITTTISKTTLSRITKELRMMETSPPPGISVWTKEDRKIGEANLLQLEAVLIGPPDTPYEGGAFHLDLQIPERYPFEPPKVRFTTPIYHPNIDEGGRICLDTLSMPPKGVWQPSINIATLLTTIRVLMGTPNPDDPLVIDIIKVYKNNPRRFVEIARKWTEQYAKEDSTSTTTIITTTKKRKDVPIHAKENIYPVKEAKQRDDRLVLSTSSIENKNTAPQGEKISDVEREEGYEEENEQESEVESTQESEEEEEEDF